jgi:hypothetical protein
MKKKASAKGKGRAKKSVADLTPRSTAGLKGGSKIMANSHEMKKALIGNFPR